MSGTAAQTRGGAARTASVALRIAAIYLAARVVTTGFLLLASALSPADSRFGPGAGLGDYIVAWDAQFYQRIAREGYPSTLPLTDAGEIAQNAWAFMPLQPWVSAALGIPLGSWATAALVVALVTGYLCCLVLRAVVVDAVGETAALWTVVFFASAPLAVMFQVGYAEAPFLLLILLGIRCLQRRRYGRLYAIIPVMAFTRPGVLVFALLLGLFGLWRWRSRRTEPLAPREPLHIVALGVLATALGFSWQLIAGVVTGEPDAYLQTELSWRRLWMDDEGGFMPFEGWIQAGDYWFGQWGIAPAAGFALLGLALLAIGLVLAFEPHVRRLGVEVRLWAASYLLYLLAVFLPQSSIFRLLFPLSPLWGALAQPRSTVWRVSVLAACLLGQWWWIWNMYGLGTEFWQIP